MKSLIYKGVVFDDFQLYGVNKNGEELYGYYETKSLRGYDGADVYICPLCVKKYGLYTEAETDEAKNEADIECMKECNRPICGVKGCNNGNAYDCYLTIDECGLV